MRAAAKALGLDTKKPASDEWADAAAEGDGTEKPVHPLARFVDPLPETLRQPKMILPGLIAAGLVVIAGQHGVGKTTVLASIVVKVAGATELGDPLAPRYGRHVIYVSEDTAQFQRIMYAVAKAIPGAGAIIRQRVHLVEAVRMPIDQVVKVAAIYTERFTEEVDGNRLPPLVVLDTRSAIIAIDDENDNAETSQIMAALKQRFAGLPVWIVGHVAKASFGRADAKNMSARGATALEGDAHQVIFIVIEDDDQRFLIRGKTRFEAAVASCRLVSHVEQEWGVDEFGTACEIPVRHVTVEPLTAEEEGDRKAEAAETRNAEKEERARQRWAQAREEILDFVRDKAVEGVLMGKTDAAERLGGSRQQRLKVIKQLIKDGLLIVSKEWPDGVRRHHLTEGYLEALNEGERFVYERTGNRPNGRK
jgi:RecA-family ATPase